jgi:hypothetical protein
MSDRENSPAFAALPQSALKVFAAIERTIGNGSSATISYHDFQFQHHFGRKTISAGLKALDHLGMVEIEPGARLINRFKLSNRWRTIDGIAAVRLAELAKEQKPHRTFEKQRQLKPVMPAPAPKPLTVERRRIEQRRMPSLPTTPWQDDGRAGGLLAALLDGPQPVGWTAATVTLWWFVVK